MADLKFVHIGMDHVVQANRVLAIIPPNLKSGKRYKELAEGRGMFINGARGRIFRAFVIMDDGTVIASAISVKTLMNRMNRTIADETDDSWDESEGLLDFDEQEEET